MEQAPLINRVAQSGIITLNLEDFFPQNSLQAFDLKDYLFRGLILREKDFRQALSEMDWTQFADKYVYMFCSTEAIIPMWAYQLLALHLAPHAALVLQGDLNTLLTFHYLQTLQAQDWTLYMDKMVVVKGCGQKPVPASAYAEVARLLQPYAKSIMYGEPCSTVPLYKKKKQV